jgi:prepilin-type N-terminal cleavage/methylation domain-containing protein
MKSGRVGYTLTELLATLAVVGILAALAAPALHGMIARIRARAALDQLVGDIAYARAAAVRRGSGVELRFQNEGDCLPSRPGRYAATRYQVVTPGPDREVMRTEHVFATMGAVCLETNNDTVLAFNSRGLPRAFQNRTLWARRGTVADSATVSVFGRVRRLY